VPGLRITIDEDGVTLGKSEGTPVWVARWEDVLELATAERTKLPDNSNGLVVMVTTIQHRAHRFVLPANDPSQLEAGLAALARRKGVEPVEAPAERSLPTVAWVVFSATAVALLLLLLSAGHVIHL
jgi:hypothetical protein